MKISNCKMCGISVTAKYYKPKVYCSRKCRDMDPVLKAQSLTAQQKTYLTKYGGHPMKTSATKIKQQDVMVAKYGVKSALLLSIFKDKSSDTKMLRYGTLAPNIVKARSTKLDKYGSATYNGQRKRTQLAIETKMLEWDDIQLIDFDTTLPIKDQSFTVKCNVCGYVWVVNLSNGYHPSCKVCSDKHGFIRISKGHLEVVDFLNSLNLPYAFIINDRKELGGDELDIYIPLLRLAIEFNGVYWHSSLFKDKDYHIKKTVRCLARGISLIQLFDFSWWSKKELLQSMLSAKLGIFKQRLFARKCSIRIVNTSDKKVFLDYNHLQGTANSSVNIGLYYENELVSILTMGKPRFDNVADAEVIRFANKRGVQIVGGFSKMLQYYIRNYNPHLIITYCDRTWSSGDTYFKAGFTFHNFTPPNYFYIKNGLIFPRQLFQKHLLSNSLSIFDTSKTEADNMQANGYLKFWDCGNIKLYYNVDYIKKKP